jgi:hypothetical protein
LCPIQSLRAHNHSDDTHSGDIKRDNHPAFRLHHETGRVWIEFSGAARAPQTDAPGEGQVQVETELRAEIVDPPVPIQEWAAGR